MISALLAVSPGAKQEDIQLNSISYSGNSRRYSYANMEFTVELLIAMNNEKYYSVNGALQNYFQSSLVREQIKQNLIKSNNIYIGSSLSCNEVNVEVLEVIAGDDEEDDQMAMLFGYPAVYVYIAGSGVVFYLLVAAAMFCFRCSVKPVVPAGK